jgi:hypothetical protein
MLYANVRTGAYMLYTVSIKAVHTYSSTTHAVSGIIYLYIYTLRRLHIKAHSGGVSGVFSSHILHDTAAV